MAPSPPPLFYKGCLSQIKLLGHIGLMNSLFRICCGNFHAPWNPWELNLKLFVHLQLDIFVHCGFIDVFCGVWRRSRRARGCWGRIASGLPRLGIKATGCSCSKNFYFQQSPRRRPKVDFSPPGSGEDPTRGKSTPEGQVRVPVLEEAAAGKVMTLALDTGFPGAVLSQELHGTGLSPENTLQRLFPLIVNPEPYGG